MLTEKNMNFTKEEIERIKKEYPFTIRKVNWYTGKEVPEEEWTFWIDDMPQGWWKSFGEDMLKDIKEFLIKYNLLDEYYISQIKEKFGSLCWYSYIPEDYDIRKEYYEILDKYEAKSQVTCINCGEPATVITKGWIMPLCDECSKSEIGFLFNINEFYDITNAKIQQILEK